MDYIEFDQRTFQSVRNLFSKRNARLLIAEIGPTSYVHEGKEHLRDFWVHLYDRPIFGRNVFPGSKELAFEVRRGTKKVKGEEWQTGYENDREYLLRPVRASSGDAVWDACRKLSEKVALNGYEFKIGFQSATARGLAHNGINICIPRDKPVRPAFEHALYTFAGRLNHSIVSFGERLEQLNPSDLPRIADYAMQDLQDGMVLARNIQAGLEADALIGKGK